MKKFILSASAFFAVFMAYYGGAQTDISLAPEVTSDSVPCVTSNKNMNCDMTPFPQAEPGMKQYFIALSPKDDEYAHRVGLLVGRMQQTDGVNLVRLVGELEKKTISGWGYDYYELTKTSDHAISTLMAPIPGRPLVTEFVTIPEKLVRYNSRLPLVIYVPNAFEVQYRIYAAGPQQTANSYSSDPNIKEQVAQPFIGDSKVQNLSTDKVHLNVEHPVQLPAGATATLRLYDALLADTDSTYGISTVTLKALPATIDLPVAQPDKFIAGPAVGVTIKDREGQLLYLNDTATMLNDKGTTTLDLIKVQ